jgi:hypothetical protein
MDDFARPRDRVKPGCVPGFPLQWIAVLQMADGSTIESAAHDLVTADRVGQYSLLDGDVLSYSLKPAPQASTIREGS